MNTSELRLDAETLRFLIAVVGAHRDMFSHTRETITTCASAKRAVARADEIQSTFATLQDELETQLHDLILRIQSTQPAEGKGMNTIEPSA